MANPKPGTKVPSSTKRADAGAKAPKMSNWDQFDSSFNDTIETPELTFNISDVERKKARNGNHGFKVETDQGTVVTFWLSTRDLCIQVDEEGVCSLIEGTTLSEPDDNGYVALIPPGSGGSFWD
jgi:hypothetical protein